MRYPKYRIVSKLVRCKNWVTVSNGSPEIDLAERYDVYEKKDFFSFWRPVDGWQDFRDMESAKATIIRQIKLDSYQSKVWEANEKNVLAEELK